MRAPTQTRLFSIAGRSRAGLFLAGCAAWVAACGTANAQEPAALPQLKIGNNGWTAIESESSGATRSRPTRRMRFEADAKGPMTIKAFSIDFDVAVRLEADNGQILAQEENSQR